MYLLNIAMPFRYIIAILCPFVFYFIGSNSFKKFLPKDIGRNFAVEGMNSIGKPRGVGIIIISVFILFSILLGFFTREFLFYYLFVFLEMLAGFFDDKAEKPWSRSRKGLIDLFLAFLCSIVFVTYNNDYSIALGNYVLNLPIPVFLGIATIMIWILINATNCSDGIDGFCGTLSIISISSIGVYFILRKENNMMLLALIMIFSVLPYLWNNSEPSSIIMGDAGSRGIGFFIGILILKTGNLLLFIPLCFVLLFDGIPGIIKIAVIRIFKIKFLKNIRTPIHDHFRNNKNWSNSQTSFRFSIIQIIISALTLFLLSSV
ncbi:MAG: phospho-N-acetylmuramoyl-pentapeptide-transferase [Oscillospiraceae bacterium]|nr:phospho-N-acetylmuramoyl-pentapeptide-transferase [Oscillospiraceae bacterium]